MLMKSSGDVLSSLAIALTTIPMPSDVHQTYPYTGKALGNMGTCVAQGFAIMFCAGMAMSSNCILSVYYVLTMRRRVAPVTFKRKFLPAIYYFYNDLSSSDYRGCIQWKYVSSPTASILFCHKVISFWVRWRGWKYRANLWNWPQQSNRTHIKKYLNSHHTPTVARHINFRRLGDCNSVLERKVKERRAENW